MLYYLFEYLRDAFHMPGAGLFRYLTFRAGGAAVTALIIAFWIGPKIIRKLKERQIGESAKLEAPETHRKKAGTPTMGGLIILAAVLIPALLFADINNAYVILIIFVTAVLGGVGFLDDYLKVVKKKPKGLIGMYKVAGQVLVGLVLGGTIYFLPHLFDQTLIPYATKSTMPFFKYGEFEFGVLYIPMVIFVITATSNAVNLTDGLDGLAAGTVAIVAMTLAVMSYVSGNAVWSEYLNIPFLRGNGELSVFCSAMAGATLGFLWFNAYPAQVFMGDTGSLALGGAIGALCVLIKKELLLPTLGFVFLMETASVIIQKAYFKYTKKRYGEGRRVFKMAPIHHHFEMLGWDEPKIVMRFYIIAVLCMIISLVSFKVR